MRGSTMKVGRFATTGKHFIVLFEVNLTGDVFHLCINSQFKTTFTIVNYFYKQAILLYSFFVYRLSPFV